MSKNKTFYTLLFTAVALFIVSFIIHMPLEVQRVLFGGIVVNDPLYSDIVNDQYKPVFIEPCSKEKVSSSVWVNNTLLTKYCRGEDFFPKPYVDYKYRHAPLNGFIWIAVTYATYMVTPRDHAPVMSSDYALAVTYTLYSALILISLLIVFKYLYMINRELGVDDKVLFYASILLSSFIMYSVYSWEVFSLVFLTSMIYWFIKQNYLKTYLFLGLFTATTPLGFVFIFYFLYKVFTAYSWIRRGRDLGALLAGLSTYFILSLISPSNVLGYFTWFNNGFCNNCVYLLFINDVWSQVLKGLFVAVWVVALTIYLALDPRSNDPLHSYALITLLLGYSITLNLSYTPQSLLYLLPLLPPLYRVFETYRPLLPHYLIDAANSLIMTLWFKDLELRKALSFLGLTIKHDPWDLESPIQWIAQIRNAVSIILVLILTYKYLTIKSNQTRR